MKKFCLVFIVALTGGSAFSETILRDYYYVKTDVLDSTVKKNTCLVTGFVNTAYSDSPVASGVISNLDRSSNTKTNAQGAFSLVISSRDTAIFFYHPDFAEIVCWNYDFKSGHHVIMNFVTSEKMPEGMMIMEEKPVVYLYSESDLSVNLKYSNFNDFTFTYPAYTQTGWNIEIKNEQLSVGGQNYPYLFWEGTSNHLDFIRSDNGVVADFINTDSTVSYLENSLGILGLNSTESTDFITYWGPRIKQYPFSQIQFLVDEQYDQEIGQLELTVKPDAKRRVYLLFTGYHSQQLKPELLPQQLSSFERKGFTVVEWGGSELKLTDQL